MMWRTERTMPDQWRPGGELVGYGVNACHIERFFDAHLGQDAGQGAGKQRLPGAGAAHHQHIVPKKPSHFTSILALKSLKMPVLR
jgi:hypothetical protein